MDTIKINENNTKFLEVSLPDYVINVARVLQKEGYEAHLVGGSVRDLLVGKKPSDYDIATDAKPEDLLLSFPHSVATGIKYGTVLVLSKDKEGERHSVEVTTYRSEANYVDGRWPSSVKFVTEISKDLGRRDFTINALALVLHTVALDSGDSSNKQKYELIDLFNGVEDLQKGILRCVGSAEERFSEDGLRMFRACRLASQLELSFDEEIFQGIEKSLHIAKKISTERIRDELVKMLMKSPKPSVGIDLMRQVGLLEIVIPEILEGIDVDQPMFHAHDVYEHTLSTVDRAEDPVKLAALFHDIAKPRCADGKGHFYGHDKLGAEMASDIMRRLKFSKAETKRVSTLVANHMFYYPYYDVPEDRDRKSQPEGYWTDAAIRRFLRRVGEENVEDLFKLRIADAEGNPMSSWDPREIEALERRISEVRMQDLALKVEDLDITGHDLIELGIQRGPEIGKILNFLLEKVIDEPKLNKKESLIAIVQNDYIGS